MPEPDAPVATATTVAPEALDGEGPIEPDGTERVDWWRAAAGGVAATVVSLIASWHVSFWTDEAATISASRRSLAELWDMVGQIDVVHGAYYAFMHVWTSVFGISPVSLRLPSALAVGAGAVGVYVLGHRLGGRSLATVATVVLIVLPRATWLGIEARPYAFTLAFAVWATVALLAALRRPRARTWIAYGVLIALLIASNIYCALLLAAHGVSVLIDRRLTWRQRWTWALAGGIGAVVTLPLVYEASGQTGQLGGDDLGLSQLVRNVAVNQWFLGNTPTTTTGVDTTTVHLSDIGSWWEPASVGLALVGWALILLGVIVAVRRGGAPLRALGWLVPWVVVPTVIIGLYSVAVEPMYSSRYLSFATPAVAVLIAIGVLALGRRWQQGLAIAAIVALSLPIYVSQRERHGKSSSDWADVAAFIDSHARPGDGVYFTPRYDLDSKRVGQTTRGIATAYPDAFDGLVDLTLRTSPADAHNLTGFSRLLADSTVDLDGLDTVWVVQRNDYAPARAQADEERLTAAGFERTVFYEGPLDTVVRYQRA